MSLEGYEVLVMSGSNGALMRALLSRDTGARALQTRSGLVLKTAEMQASS
jgi:hypothetical protein